MCQSCTDSTVVRGRKRRERCKANGICYHCNKAATHGAFCEAHAERSDASSKFYLNRKNNGLCVLCGELKVDDNIVCSHCSNMRKTKQQNRQEQGLCTSCGKQPVVKPWTYCESCREIRNRKSVTSRYSQSRNSPRAKKVGWTLSFEEYATIVTQPCIYCKLTNDVKNGSGLDRTDNNKGYDLSNVVSCCALCNMTRGDRYTPEEMLTFIGPKIREVKLARLSNESKLPSGFGRPGSSDDIKKRSVRTYLNKIKDSRGVSR